MRSRVVRLIRSTRPHRACLLPAARIPLRAVPPVTRPQLRITPLQPQLCRWSSSQAPLADPSRPDLFYHLLPFPRDPDPSQSIPVYALSFLPAPPSSPRSATVLGWLPAVTEAGTGDEDAGLNDFVENRASSPCTHVPNISYQHLPTLFSTVPTTSARSGPASTARGCRRRLEQHRHSDPARMDAHSWYVPTLRGWLY